MGREVSSLVLAASPATLSVLEGVVGDVLDAARVTAHQLVARADLEPGLVEVVSIEFVERVA